MITEVLYSKVKYTFQELYKIMPLLEGGENLNQYLMDAIVRVPGNWFELIIFTK